MENVRGCGSSGPDRQHIPQNSLSHITDGALYVGLSSQLVESKSTEVCLQYFNFIFKIVFPNIGLHMYVLAS